MTRDFGLYSFGIHGPHFHHGDEALADLDWKLLAQFKDLFRQILNHLVPLF